VPPLCDATTGEHHIYVPPSVHPPNVSTTAAIGMFPPDIRFSLPTARYAMARTEFMRRLSYCGLLRGRLAAKISYEPDRKRRKP
jgi:hypothetical protein